MAMRMIEVFLPESVEAHVKEVFKELPVLNVWYERFNNQKLMVKALADTGHVQTVLDAMDRFADEDGYRVMVLKVEAAIPRPDDDTPDEPLVEKPAVLKRRSISREELYTEVSKGVEPSATFVWMVILSSLVACIGLLKDSAAVVIGAMVIAPLLGPNVGLALSTTLADGKLALKALRANALGIFIAFVISTIIGFAYQQFYVLLGLDPLNSLGEVLARTRVDFLDVALALVSGLAGALSLTTGLSATLIGVMVAVALLPPLATFSMFLGAGNLELALGALLLLAVNVICVNLAGVVTFLIQGIQPATWWEAKRAKRSTAFALVTWAILLAGLLVLLSLSRTGLI